MMYDIFGGSDHGICFEPTCREYEACLNKEQYSAQIAV